MTYVGNRADILDTRNILKRIEELETELEDGYPEGSDDPRWDGDPEVIEMGQLRALIQEVAGHSGDRPSDGITLIRESYFTDYAQEYFEETRDDTFTEQWPYNHIDWDAAADELRVDYTEIDYDGVAYLFR